MENQFVSEPMDFNYKEGNAVDFAKTFDLSGNNNDEMLKIYLRKAGLSDNIEYLTAEQRRAFIYDIVKSNKNPGYWKPSVLSQMRTPTTVPIYNPPPPVERLSSITLDSIDDIPPASMTFDYTHYTQANSSTPYSNGGQPNKTIEQKKMGGSTLYERQFKQQTSISNKPNYSPPPTPLPTTTLVTRKGRKIDVSGPMNFKHISGDLARDKTKNAFDLSGQCTDNTLKKYMIERGISEEEVSGLDSKDLIRRIVQSEFTWMPKTKESSSVFVPPPPSETYVAPAPVPTPPERVMNHSKGGALIIVPPVVPSIVSPPNENIYEELVQPKPSVRTSIRRSRIKMPPPPPVPVATSQANKDSKKGSIPVQPFTSQAKPPLGIITNKSAKEIPIPPPPPPPPPMALEKMSENVITSIPEPAPISIEKNLGKTEPSMKIKKTEVMATQSIISGGVPPPPPPPPPAMQAPKPLIDQKSETQAKPIESGGDPRDAFLQSIRAGVTLKKVEQKKTFKNKPIVPVKAKQPVSTIPSDDVEQAPLKSEKPDFMSELRNATLKRIKKLENNPYASESTC